MGLKTYELDPAHFLTAPGLAWPAALYQYVINGRKKYQRRNMICLLFINIQKLLTNTLKIMIKIKNHYTLKLVSAIFHYFSKTNVFLCYFKWSKSKRNLTYSCFFFPLFHEHLFSPGLPCATRLLETSCLEKIMVGVIETMLVILPLGQMNKAQREVNRTNQVQTKINIMNGLQASVIHLIPGSTCHWISNRMRYFLKNIFWLKHFPETTSCRIRHSLVFLVKPVLRIS